MRHAVASNSPPALCNGTVVTAIATTGFYVWQQWSDETSDMRRRSSTVLMMLAELSEFGLYTDNRSYLQAILEGLSAEGDMAYAVIGRFAAGNLDITAILPTLERAVFRLTADNETLGVAAREHEARPRQH